MENLFEVKIEPKQSLLCQSLWECNIFPAAVIPFTYPLTITFDFIILS